jgi:hypothetical protein
VKRGERTDKQHGDVEGTLTDMRGKQSDAHGQGRRSKCRSEDS